MFQETAHLDSPRTPIKCDVGQLSAGFPRSLCLPPPFFCLILSAGFIFCGGFLLFSVLVLLKLEKVLSEKH